MALAARRPLTITSSRPSSVTWRRRWYLLPSSQLPTPGLAERDGCRWCRSDWSDERGKLR
jgi:hypothetical protein